ncbi:MAG: DUF547 domain-containing protein [Chitinophagales bacterium]
MNKIRLFFSILIIGITFISCNKSVDKSAAKTDAMDVVKSLNESPQPKTTTTLSTNTEINKLEVETDKQAVQEEERIVENKTEPTPKKTEVEPQSKVIRKEQKKETPTIISSKPTISSSQNKSSDKKTIRLDKPQKNLSSSNAPRNFMKISHSFLSEYVSGGLVAYSNIGKPDINKLIEQIATTDLSEAKNIEKQTFYINAYNILVIKSILENNIPSSPLDVSGFFDTQKHKVAGEILTLDQVEKGKLFGLKKDPRFHFAVVCGAIGCPQIEPFAYTPSKLNAQLDHQTKKALNDPNFTKVNDAAKKIELSEIFKWYKADFTQGGKSLIDYINQYRNEAIPSDYTVDYYPYNWKVNKQ